MSMKEQRSRFKPYKKNGRFYNDEKKQKAGFMWQTALMFCGSIVHRIRDACRGSKQWIVNQDPLKKSMPLEITWIGHSTFLIQVGNINILIDPLFGNVSPLFPRILSPGVSLDQLPEIDIVLISHNHRDHMEHAALCALNNHPDVQFLVPAGLGQWFDYFRLAPCKECDWWQQVTINKRNTSITCTFLPAHHWSQRAFLDKNRSLWGSWMIQCNGYTIYFAGDSTYSDHFSIIADCFPSIDIAFLPIGPCEPHYLLGNAHMDVDQAGRAFFDLNASHFMPMHWGTFHFGSEPFDLPITRLKQWKMAHSDRLGDKKVHIVKVGQRVAL